MRLFIIISIMVLSSCSTTKINGVNMKDKKSTRIDQKTHNVMLITFVLGYGITYHFYYSRP